MSAKDDWQRRRPANPQLGDCYRRNDQVLQINIRGYVFPWGSDGPFLFHFSNKPDFFLAIFSTPQKLAEYLPEWTGRVKQIEDAQEFMRSVFSKDVRLIVNPYIHDNKTTRWTEIPKHLHVD